MATKQDIAKLIVLLSAAFPNWTPNEYTTEVYYQDLQDIPTEELFVAAQHCRSEAGRKFAPSTGEIRGTVSELRKMSSNLPSSFQAWEEVQRNLIENGGDFGTPVWTHVIVEQAVRSIGWRNIRMSENPTADRARFLQAYDQLTERAAKENMLIPDVRGFLESNGAQLSAPIQIKALADGMKK